VVLATDSGASATDKITKVSTLTVSGIESGASWEYSLDAGTNWNTGAGSTITGITGDGAKSVTLRQTDAAGNTSAASSAYAFTLDTQVPTLSSNTPLDNAQT
jgi:hypothetical protein